MIGILSIQKFPHRQGASFNSDFLVEILSVEFSTTGPKIPPKSENMSETKKDREPNRETKEAETKRRREKNQANGKAWARDRQT